MGNGTFLHLSHLTENAQSVNSRATQKRFFCKFRTKYVDMSFRRPVVEQLSQYRLEISYHRKFSPIWTLKNTKRSREWRICLTESLKVEPIRNSQITGASEIAKIS